MDEKLKEGMNIYSFRLHDEGYIYISSTCGEQLTLPEYTQRVAAFERKRVRELEGENDKAKELIRRSGAHLEECPLRPFTLNMTLMEDCRSFLEVK